ncbi:ComF family protein [Dyadobacter sp. NIV53]|uniref:ComF family protein n=1 Tax=Dyadobacter sp. NIV53 TaxID=2861765 RepID=UPI001C8433A2|nr:phosphoribosyltransferase family protein [Dyadobacter sp. NIV53]
MNLKIFWSDFIDLIFPRCCEACDRSLVGNEELVCTSCRISLPRIEKHSVHIDLLKYKFITIPEVLSVQSFLLFTKKGKVQKLLHALKYRGNKEVGILLGSMFGQEMVAERILPKAELIISVPLHKKKLSKRGYNQSDLLAEGLSNATDIPWSGTVLARTRFTDTQTGKSKKERQENVSGVFVVNGEFKKKSVIVIDDVLTTGATLEACVEALKIAGCEEFHILTIAVAQH